MVEAAPAPETLGFREFAQRHGWKPSYVSQLRRDGRLVLTADKRRILVAETNALIAASRDPAKAGVAARHAAARGAAATSASTARDPGQGGDSGADTPAVAPENPLALRRARAQAEREEAGLRKALRDEQIELGELLQRAEVVAAVGDCITTLRTSLQNLPATLGPELAAATAEDRCRQLLSDGIEHVLEELARKFGAIGRAAA